MDLERRLLFVDSRRSEQVEWLSEQLYDNSHTSQNRIILIAGSPLKLQEQLDLPVYFDQNGELTTKFGIRASPAVAEQEGKRLRVIEINLMENSHV